MAAAVNGTVAAAAAAPPPLAPLPSAAAPASFPSHLDAPAGSLDPRAVAFCEILSKVAAHEVEPALSRSGIPPIASLVEPVLRYSYSNPAAAVRFFRWAALSSPHSPASWNLMVDLLGRNSLFEAMWDAIRSMRDEPSHPLSPSTFVSAFNSYCLAGRVKEAFMTFEVMDRYGVPADAFVLNSLLSAVCRAAGNHTAAAAEFLDRIKDRITPDGDTYAILLEGWEREGDLAGAKRTFGEMVVRLGWDPANTAAHDAFLGALVRGGEASEALKFMQVMRSKGCLPGLTFFSSSLERFVREKNLAQAAALWGVAIEAGLPPSTEMYNAMIEMHCERCDFAPAFALLDDMPLQGSFPDSLTYNTIFECLVKGRKVREAEAFLREMRKNEWPPSPANCAAAIRMFFEEFDPESALQVWRCMVENDIAGKEECANEILVGMRDLGKMEDVKRYADEILDMRIELYSATMAKLRSGFQKARKMDLYDRIERIAKVR